MTDEAGREAHLSAEQARAEAAARIPRPHGHQRGPQGPVSPPGQGPQAAVGLSGAKPAAIGRLKARAEFLFVQKGVRAGGATLAMQARRRAAEGPPRIGFTATRKTGSAVIRNRARRRLKEAARRLLPEFGLPGVDYVALAREGTAAAPWPRLLDDMRIALLRLSAALQRAAPGDVPRPPAPSPTAPAAPQAKDEL